MTNLVTEFAKTRAQKWISETN